MRGRHRGLWPDTGHEVIGYREFRQDRATEVIETGDERVMAMNELREVRQRREVLLSCVTRLEAALAAPATDTRWPEGVGDALSSLRATLEEHVTQTEAPDGIFDQVRDRAPRLCNQIDRLVDEHVTIVADTERLIDRLDHAPAERTAEETASIREQALELIAAIMRHRQQGADLFYEAYNVDVGGPD
jgi:hypothetical protein